MPTAKPKPRGLTYASSGVDLEQKDTFTESLESTLRTTYGPRVISNPGGFAGLFRLDYNERLFARNYKDPVLVACCDGVGTKVKLAADMGVYDTVGIDLVAMNVNDMIVQGAEPLIFLDYIAVPTVNKAMLSALVKGIAEGCKRSGCALLGGETANMPDIYAPGDFDLAGFAVGIVELKRAMKPTRVRSGDVVLGLSSDGIHSNGYTLVRNVVKHAKLDLNKCYEELREPATKAPKRQRAKAPNGKKARTLGEVLLTPTRIYVRPIVKLLKGYEVKKVISGMAHITGSGLAGNLCRALPPTLDAVIERGSWPVPPVFTFLQKHGDIDDVEMDRVFNMGIGYCIIVRPAFADSVAQHLKKLGERVHTIGRIEKGKGEVRYV